MHGLISSVKLDDFRRAKSPKETTVNKIDDRGEGYVPGIFCPGLSVIRPRRIAVTTA
jgi:hypothetical protein